MFGFEAGGETLRNLLNSFMSTRPMLSILIGPIFAKLVRIWNRLYTLCMKLVSIVLKMVLMQTKKCHSRFFWRYKIWEIHKIYGRNMQLLNNATIKVRASCVFCKLAKRACKLRHEYEITFMLHSRMGYLCPKFNGGSHVSFADKIFLFNSLFVI